MKPSRKPLTDHLGELRTRIIRFVLVFLVAAAIGFFSTPQIISLLLPPEGYLVVLGPLDAFLIRLYLGILGGLILSFPALLFEIYGFIRPALLPGEKWAAYGVGLAAILLFLAGVLLAYALLPTTLNMLLSFAGKDLQPMFAADRYFGFIFWFLLVFGIAFQLPIVLLGLLRFGILELDVLKRSRKFAVLAILILAAVLTPTQDVFTLLLLAGPLYLLFEGTLLVASVWRK